MYFPNKNDEWYTLSYAVEPILEFLKPNSTILCPFDTKDSEYVKVLMNAEHEVTYRHIKDGFDFFDLESKDVLKFDYIISNPPYSIRKQVFNKLEELNKPFAMLVPLVSIALKPIREKLQDKQYYYLIKESNLNQKKEWFVRILQVKPHIFVKTFYPDKLCLKS
jgi:16S rRNA A1518/A1519 N6-dimethyltransferase RsmA/KsgA/DIM1 with predicted DNA glycosylase/AP lyase activity